MREQHQNGRYADEAARFSSEPKGIIDSVLDGVSERAKDGGENMDKTIKDASNTMGEAAHCAKDGIAKVSSQLADGVGRVVTSSSERLEEGINWGKKMIENPSVAKVSDEVRSVIKKYPLQSLLGAVFVGAWLGSKIGAPKSS